MKHGKSTLLKFIYCMLYGASKNKNGKEISDFEKYIPWNNEEYSGKINYELDNKEKYEIFRDFRKKNPKIYNENLEEISKEFNINKTKGIEFFYEQTKIDEELFKNTVLVEQGESKLDKVKQNTLIQKITNLISTGDDKISYKKAIEKLNKKLIEEVGTERTIGRPINNIEEKIKILENKKINIEKNNEEIILIEKEQNKIKKEIEEQEKRIRLIKRIKFIKETEKIELEKINTNNKIKEELEEKINQLKKELNNNREKIKINKIKYIILFILNILIGIIYFIIKENILLIMLAIGIGVFLTCLILDSANKSKLNKKINEERKKTRAQIRLIEENKEKIEETIKEIKSKNIETMEIKKIEIKKEYNNKLEIYEIEKIINKKYEEIIEQIEREENELTTLKLKLGTLEIEKNKIGIKEEDNIEIGKEIIESKKEKEKIKSLENSINIAKEALELAYEKAKQNITPKFSAKLSECIGEISTNKYQNVNFSDENGLQIELKNGNYIPVEYLSTGTIDQMYLALRINAISEIVEEKLPIILDEAFVYYDNERMENILSYIYEEYKNNQILIFTCSEREEKILEKININYNKIQI